MAEMNVDFALAKNISTDVEAGKLILPPSLRSIAHEYKTGLTACTAHIDKLTKPLQKNSGDPQVQELINWGKQSCSTVGGAEMTTSLFVGIKNRLAKGDKEVLALVQKYASQPNGPQN